MPKKEPSIKYDVSWKYILTTMFKHGVELFYKELYDIIDFNQPIIFIESKLTNLDVGLKNNSKIVDKLIQCSLLDGRTQHLLLHIEIEANNPYTISERMFTYYCALKLKFPDKKIQALIIYLGKDNPPKWHLYRHKDLALKMSFTCKYYNIATANEKKLLKSDNPFIYIVLFSKWLFKNKQTMKKRFTISKKLFLLMKERQIDLEMVKNIFVFVKKQVSLSNEMEKEISIIIYNKSKNMYGKIKNLAQVEAINESFRIMHREGKDLKDYISKGLKKGRKEGRQLGIQEGRQEGEFTNLTNNILKMNQKGFPAIEIAKILDLKIDFVEKIIAQNN